MNPVRIVTDSTADVPADLVAGLGISVVPCQIYFGRDAYRDGVDLSTSAFLEKLAAAHELPRTSQPAVADFLAAYRSLLEECPAAYITSIHVAGDLSGTVNAAWAAAQMLPDPSRVEVIDSGQVSMGMGWAVVRAAQMARSGAGKSEIAQAVRGLLPRLRVIAMIDTLASLRKGGRVSYLSAALGTMLQIKPLLTIQDGRVWVLEKVRTRSRALAQLVAQVGGWGPVAELAVLHTGAEDLAASLAAMLQGVFPAERTLIGLAGAALASHLGPGAVGACALLDQPAEA